MLTMVAVQFGHVADDVAVAVALSQLKLMMVSF